MWNIFPRSDVVVTGHNAEMADMSNPSGAIHGEEFYLVADSHSGYRRISPPIGMNLDRDTALRAAEEAQAKVESGELNPMDWPATRPAYGSVAWEESGQEAQDVWDERHR